MCRGSNRPAGGAVSVQTFLRHPSPALPLAFLPTPRHQARCRCCRLPVLTRACASPCPLLPLSLAPVGRGPAPWHCHLGTLPWGFCTWGEPTAGRTPGSLPRRGHSSSILLGSPSQPLAAAPQRRGYRGRVPSPVPCVSNQEPVIWLYLHCPGDSELGSWAISSTHKALC